MCGVNEENAVMRERARIRERLVKIKGEDLLVVTSHGTQTDLLIKRSEVLELLHGSGTQG